MIPPVEDDSIIRFHRQPDSEHFQHNAVLCLINTPHRSGCETAVHMGQAHAPHHR
jgi:hypothetical protein